MKKRELKPLSVWRYQRNQLKLLLFLLRYPRLFHRVLKIMGPAVPKREKHWNSGPRHSFSMLGGGLVSASDLAAMRLVYLDYLDHMDAILNAEKSGKKVVWSEFNLSNELLRVFGAVTYVPEALSIMGHHMGTDVVVDFVAAAEKEGLPAEYCSAGKSAIGAHLLGQAPRPDLIVSSSHPCDSVVSSYQVLAYLTKAPLFTLDTPYWDNDECYAYYAKNLMELIGVLEETLEKKLDWDELKKTCETMNITNRYLSEYTEMAKADPSPVNLTCLLLGWQHGVCTMGSPRAAKYAKIIRDNAKKRLDDERGFIPNQKIRIIWYDIPIAFHFLEPWLNKTFGAVTVADFMGRVSQSEIDTQSRDTMLHGLAKAHLNIAMARQCRGPAEFFTGELSRIIEEYNGHCFIFTRHQGCKTSYAMGKLISDVCRRAGLPALFLATDSFDKRCVNEEQVKQQITDFFREYKLA